MSADGSAPRGLRHLPALLLEPARNRATMPGMQGHERRKEVGAHRHGDLGRARRRRRAAVARMVDQRPVGLVADRRDQRNGGSCRRAHHRLVVETPEIFEAAAAARDDEEVRPRDGAADLEPVEAGDRPCHLVAGRLALHPHRPDQHMHGKPVGDAVADVADDRSGRRGDDADHLRQERQRPLARLGEEPFCLQLAPPLVEQRHQRPGTGRLDVLDDDLVFRRTRIGRQLAGGHDLQALFRLEGQLGKTLCAR